MTTVKLPNKLSELLRLAVRDAQAVEANPLYRLDMAVYHEPIANEDEETGERTEYCAVCMAGAVMANTLGADPDCETGPSEFGETEQLYAIDNLRSGDLDDAFASLDLDPDPAQEAAADAASELIRKGYDCYLGRAPWPVYLEAADILAKAGL